MVSGIGGITGLDDASNGISSVPAQVFDENFGSNYSILYSPENVAGGYNFEGAWAPTSTPAIKGIRAT